MTSRTRILLVVAALVAGSFGISFLWVQRVGAGDWVTRGFAIAALALSFATAFRAEFFVFDPVVVGGGNWWVKGQIKGKGPHLALTLQLVNRGYGEGVIEWIALTLRHKSWHRPYPFETVMDLDPQKLVAEKGTVTADSQRAPYTSIALAARSVASYTILFAPCHLTGEDDPELTAGEYEFVCYIKVAGEDGPRIALEFEKAIKEEVLKEYVSGKGFFFPNTSFRPEQIVPGVQSAGRARRASFQ